PVGEPVGGAVGHVSGTGGERDHRQRVAEDVIGEAAVVALLLAQLALQVPTVDESRRIVPGDAHGQEDLRQGADVGCVGSADVVGGDSGQFRHGLADRAGSSLQGGQRRHHIGPRAGLAELVEVGFRLIQLGRDPVGGGRGRVGIHGGARQRGGDERRDESDGGGEGGDPTSVTYSHSSSSGSEGTQ